MLRVRAAAALVAAPLAFAALVLPASADPLAETVVTRAFEAIASAPPTAMEMRIPLTEAVRSDRLPIAKAKKVETITVEERVGNAMSLLSRMPTYDTDEPEEP